MGGLMINEDFEAEIFYNRKLHTVRIKDISDPSMDGYRYRIDLYDRDKLIRDERKEISISRTLLSMLGYTQDDLFLSLTKLRYQLPESISSLNPDALNYREYSQDQIIGVVAGLIRQYFIAYPNTSLDPFIIRNSLPIEDDKIFNVLEYFANNSILIKDPEGNYREGQNWIINLSILLKQSEENIAERVPDNEPISQSESQQTQQYQSMESLIFKYDLYETKDSNYGSELANFINSLNSGISINYLGKAGVSWLEQPPYKVRDLIIHSPENIFQNNLTILLTAVETTHPYDLNNDGNIGIISTGSIKKPKDVELSHYLRYFLLILILEYESYKRIRLNSGRWPEGGPILIKDSIEFTQIPDHYIQALKEVSISDTTVLPFLESFNRLAEAIRYAYKMDLSKDTLPSAKKSQTLTLILADIAEGEDIIGIENEVNAFANIILSKEIHPPLAIGLFGDWGSGKTFFMNKLNDRITGICKKLRQNKDNNNHPFCEDVVQINFNAWHYVESNLWASLVNHIFENLKSTAEPESDEIEENKKKQLLAKLETTAKIQLEYEKEITAITDKIEIAEKEYEKIREKYLNEASQLEKKKIADIYKEIKENKDIVNKYKSAFEDLGITQIGKSYEDIITTIKEIKSIQGSFKLYIHTIFLNPKLSFWKVTILSAAIILFALLPFLISELRTLVGFDFLNNITSTIFRIALVLSTVLGWIKLSLKKIQTPLNTLNEIFKITTDSINEANNQKAEEIRKSEKLLEELIFKQNKIKNNLNELQIERASIEKELKEMTSQYRLLKFIKERVASDDYSKNLGLLTMIRRDFEKISDLMTEQQREGKNEDLPSIDRIILYIDDLDRCPTDRVIEVLQAIHLLLALPLFVVIVGVDSRWVVKSLQTNYEGLIDENLTKSSQDSKAIGQVNAASAQDYLEKIFQIPFWIPQMTPESSRQLVEYIIEKGEIKEKTKSPEDDILRSLPETQSLGRTVSAISENSADSPDAGIKAIENIETAEPLNNAIAEPNLDPLTLTEQEKKIMGDLSGLVGRSPRTIKRFVNTYRLIKISRLDTQETDFIGNQDRYTSVLLLLAILSCQNSVSQVVFSQIRSSSRTTLAQFVDDLVEDSNNCEWSRFLSNIKRFSNEHGNNVSIDILKKWIPYISRFGYSKPLLVESNFGAI